MKLGQSKDSNDFKRRKIEKLKDGDNVYRILPAMGSMADKGVWAKYMKVEWGYKDSAGNNRPFQDVRVVNQKTKMVEVESEAHLFREGLIKKFVDALDLFKKGKISQDELKKFKEEKERFNLEKKFYLNAVNRNNEIVLLKIGYRAKQALDAEIKKLKSEGIDPRSEKTGRFFVFNRSGNGTDTVYSVSVLSENIKHPELGLVSKQVEHVLTEDLLSRLDTEAMDLGDLEKMYPKVTSEQVYRIVHEGPKAVDEILGERNSSKQETASEDHNEEDVADHEEEANSEKFTTANASKTAEMSKEDFLKSLGV